MRVRTGTAGTGSAAITTLLLLGLVLEERLDGVLTICAHRAHACPGVFMMMVVRITVGDEEKRRSLAYQSQC